VFSSRRPHTRFSRDWSSDVCSSVLGINEPHHPVSHHGDKPEHIERYAKLTTYQIAKFSEFVGKLAATPDGDGTLLDSAVLYWGKIGRASCRERSNAAVSGSSWYGYT